MLSKIFRDKARKTLRRIKSDSEPVEVAAGSQPAAGMCARDRVRKPYVTFNLAADVVFRWRRVRDTKPAVRVYPSVTSQFREWRTNGSSADCEDVWLLELQTRFACTAPHDNERVGAVEFARLARFAITDKMN